MNLITDYPTIKNLEDLWSDICLMANRNRIVMGPIQIGQPTELVDTKDADSSDEAAFSSSLWRRGRKGTRTYNTVVIDFEPRMWLETQSRWSPINSLLVAIGVLFLRT